MSDITVVSTPVIVEVSPQVYTVTVSSVGAQGATGATGAKGDQGNSGVIAVTAPITNSGTSTSANIGINAGVANGVATLDGSGLIPTSQLPPLAVNDTFVVASQAAMLALTAQVGDVAVRTDINQTFILQASPPTTLGNWVQILTPPAITSITASSPLTGGTITSTGTIGISDASTTVKGAVQLTDSTSSTSTTTAATPASVKSAYDLANGKASLTTANTFTTGTQIIATGSDATVGLRVKRNSATQSANLLEITQSDGTSILAKVDSAGAITSAGAVSASTGISTGTGDLTLGSAGSAAGSVKFGTTGGYQLLAAGTGASNTQTLPTGASGTLLNTNITSLPSGITSLPNVTSVNSTSIPASSTLVTTATTSLANLTSVNSTPIPASSTLLTTTAYRNSVYSATGTIDIVNRQMINGVSTLALSQINFQGVTPVADFTLNSVSTIFSAVTGTSFQAGLFSVSGSTLTLLASTTAVTPAVGLNTTSFASPQTLTAGTTYAIGMLFNGTSNSTLRATIFQNAILAGFGTNALTPFMSAFSNSTSFTTMPSVGTVVSLQATAPAALFFCRLS
jgi:hypothetical protein